MTFAWSNTEQRRVKYVFSAEPVVFGPTVVFFSKRKFPNGIHFTEYKDLVGYTMLGDEYSWYAEDFKKAGVSTVWMRDTSDEWKMLLLGRGDALLAETYQGLYELQQLDQESDAYKESIGFTNRSYPEESESPDHLIFSKPHFDKRRRLIRDSIDKALKKLDVTTAVRNLLDEQFSGDTRQVQ